MKIFYTIFIFFLFTLSLNAQFTPQIGLSVNSFAVADLPSDNRGIKYDLRNTKNPIQFNNYIGFSIGGGKRSYIFQIARMAGSVNNAGLIQNTGTNDAVKNIDSYNVLSHFIGVEKVFGRKMFGDRIFFSSGIHFANHQIRFTSTEVFHDKTVRIDGDKNIGSYSFLLALSMHKKIARPNIYAFYQAALAYTLYDWSTNSNLRPVKLGHTIGLKIPLFIY